MTEAPGYRTLTGPGIVCMIVSAGLLATSDGVVKWLADGYPISQIIVLRGAFILLPMFILAWRTGKLGSLCVSQLGPQALRAILFTGSVFCFLMGSGLIHWRSIQRSPSRAL
jgi:hypothetical protein